MGVQQHILVFRFSALGDVAMTVPVLRLLLLQHPELQVTMVGSPFMHPMFDGIDRLKFIGADTKKDYKGIGGLYKLARKLKTNIPFTAVADLHNVLRTKILRTFITGVPKAVIDKGRSEKKELTRPKNKKLRPLPTGFERYAKVFETLGFPVVLDTNDGIDHHPPDDILLPTLQAPRQFRIGIAPFAKHAAKMYPLGKMKEVVRLLVEEPAYEIILLGSKQEAGELSTWESLSPQIKCMAGRGNFKQELGMIAHLDLVISMDSANMHLASLYGVPVISLWGGTHPWLGFYGWGQPYANAMQTDLPCRPSSVFGNKPCPVHGEAGCMQGITPVMIRDKVERLLLG